MGLLDTLGLKRTAAMAASGGPSPDDDTGMPSRAKGGKDGGKGGGKATPPAPPPELAAYQKSRAAVQALVDALKGHAQSASVQTQINQATAKLAEADAHAAKAEWVPAAQALAAAKAICDGAKKRADDRVTYLAKRANAVAGIMALQGITSDANMTAMTTALANADAQANASPPNYTTASTALDGINTPIRNGRKALLTSLKAQVAKLEALDAKVKAYCAADIAKGKALIAQGDAAFAAQAWSACIMHSFAAIEVISPCERMATRRGDYETARTPAVAAIAGIKALPAVQDRAPGLEALLAQADRLADRATMKFEEGVAKLGELTRRCDHWTAAAPTVAQVKQERPLADAELAALDKHAAAERVSAARENVRKLLAAATAAKDGADKAIDPGPGYRSALLAIQRARADSAAAKSIADGLGPAMAAQAAAGKPDDPAAMQQALKNLQADLAKAEAAPHADQAAVPLKTAKEQAAAAAQALAKEDGKAAAAPLAAAARALGEAKAIQARHGSFVSDLAKLQARLKALQGLPRAAKLKGRIDAVVKGIADAQALDKAHKGPEALTALHAAEDAATAAEKADADRADYDTAEGKTAARVAAVGDAKAKKALEHALAEARKLADAFRFGEAAAALKRVEVQIDEARLKALASANPADPAIATLAAQMVANGGAKEVDALVQDRKTTDPKMIALLAKGRFGVDFVFDTGARPRREAKNLKFLCQTFSKVPKDVKAAGSIVSIEHIDSASKRDISGAWGFDAKVELTGRPKLDKQGFGSKLTRRVRNKDGTISKVKQLPGKIDPDCEAVGGDAELLSFTALHEVGHGVDDANTYMAKNGSRDDHGGWTDYGAGVQPIADAVGPWVSSKVGGSNTFYKTPADKAYVLARLLNQPAVRPTHPPGSDNDKAVVEFDRWYGLATAPGIYERQSDCESITVGKLIYHEAYPRAWVSYLAAARSKGLTGYQFRAPGEWFAELYAGYKANRLGKKHPAREWLKKL
ncbi:MAG: hypothetical protein KF788_05980 [Piscinibacter sp.]|nr:hypothetical protein [Piscinibacter sp.]